MENCNPTCTPLSATERLARDTGTLLGANDSFLVSQCCWKFVVFDPHPCPDISFAMNKVC
jgi:hypothetical protein